MAKIIVNETNEEITTEEMVKKKKVREKLGRRTSFKVKEWTKKLKY